MILSHLSVGKAPSKQQQNQIKLKAQGILFLSWVEFLEQRKKFSTVSQCTLFYFLCRILKGKELGPSYTSYLNLNLERLAKKDG